MTPCGSESPIPLELFDGIDDLVRRSNHHRLTDLDREFNGSNPLVVLADGALEAMTAHLSHPIIAILAHQTGRVGVHVVRVARCTTFPEQAVQTYVSVLREHGVARPDAVETLRRRLDQFTFGTERSLEPSHSATSGA